jgi:hypothetical protein
VKKIEVDPDTGEILMHLFSRPPATAKGNTPAFRKKTGASMTLVAGAGFEPDSETGSVTRVRWSYQGERQGPKEIRRLGGVKLRT